MKKILDLLSSKDEELFKEVRRIESKAFLVGLSIRISFCAVPGEPFVKNSLNPKMLLEISNLEPGKESRIVLDNLQISLLTYILNNGIDDNL